MLVSLETLIYFGPGAAAVLDVSAGALTSDIKGTGRTQSTITAQGIISAAHVTGLKNSPMTASGSGTITTALPKAIARPSMTVSIGSRPSAFDVAQAVWGSIAATLNETGTMGNKLNTASSGGVDLEALADAVWEHESAVTLNSTALILLKVVKNKKELKKVSSVWTLIIYDDDGTTPILNKDLKDVDGNNITDITAGALAKELASNV